VHLRAWREEDDLMVAVADTGPGISEDDIHKLFRPFQQLDGSTSRRFGGTGLGLAISRGFVELHGGKIWVESREGAGSTFYFRIPFGPALAAGPGFAQWITPEWEYVQRTRPSKADRPDVPPRFVVLEKGKLLGRLLERYWDGVQVVRVGSLEEACGELGGAPSQALLINDVSVEEGLARAELVTTPFQTPVVVCSIAGIEDSLSALGVADYLVKPVAREPLLSALDRLGVREGTILIVDDKPDALHLFGRMLASSERGYRTLLAKDGEQAIRICREHPPDAMLLDLIMPNMDGFHVLRSMRGDPELRDIPVVVISARDPAGRPVVSSALAVTQDRGLSAQSLLAAIQAVTGVLSATVPTDDAVQPGASSD
jgi:CheY-like chemotaxis protein